MKKKFLLGLSLFVAMAAQAVPVFEWNMENVAEDEVGYYEEINLQEGDTRDLVEIDGVMAYHFYNSDAELGQSWQRAIKFRNLPIKENQLYRVTVGLMGTNEYLDGADIKKCNARFALMQGGENLDTPFILDGNEQVTDISRFQEPDEGKGFYNYVGTYYYTNHEEQAEIYAGKYPSKDPLPQTYFLTINVYNPGEFFINRVLVEEISISSLQYKDDRVVVDFGLAIDKSVLAGRDQFVLPAGCATVIADGEECNILSAELRKDGKLYIFTDGEISLDEDASVTVSFNNIDGVVKNIIAGEAVAVSGFENEVATYNGDLEDAYSFAIKVPELVSANPADGAFDLANDMKEFTFVFDKPVDLSRVKATLGAEELTLATTGDFASTLVFTRGEGDLANGDYTLTVSEIWPENDLLDDHGEVVLLITFGKIKVAGIEYTDVMSVLLENLGGGETANTNWTLYRDGSVYEDGGQQRVFAFSGKFENGFYLSQRGDSDASLVYGDKEDYPFTLPEGNMQITMNVSAWQGNSGNFLYELADADGNVVASGSASADVHQADKGIEVADYSRIAFNVENCKAGNYTFKLTTNSGGFGNAIIVWGLDVKKYEVGEGAKAESEVLIDENFAAVGNGNRPAWGSGWNIYGDDGFLDKAGNGLSRIMNLGSCTNMSCGYYNRFLGGDATKYCLTYGEDVKESAPEGTEEPVLILDATKYNFSWYACNWKGDNNTYYFAIYEADGWNSETLTGKEVFYKEEQVTANVQGGEKSAEAVKIEYTWAPPKAGRYILKWWMTGESEIGKIKVEKMGSMAVFWHSQLNAAIKEAEDDLANVQDDKYAGATRQALEDAINDAKTVEFHTGAECQALMDAMADARKNMKARVDAIAAYDKAYSNLAGQIAGMAGTKYEALESYTSGKAMVEKYDGMEAWTIENEVLVPLVQELTTAYDLNENLVKIGVPAMTDQINRLVDTYNKLAEYDNSKWSGDLLLSANNAITDDQEIVGLLKKLVTATVYNAIASGYEFTFSDEETLEEGVRSIDMTGFIRNSVFYAYSTERELHNTAACNAAVPGWEFEAPSGLSLNWGWGGWDAPNKPVAPVNIVNQQLGTKWGTDFKVWQNIADVPVGVYNVGSGVADDTYTKFEDGVLSLVDGKMTMSYLYAVSGETEMQKIFDIEGQGQWRAIHDNFIENFPVAQDEDAIVGSLTLGAVLDVDGAFAAVDNAKMFITGPVEGFDYAAAAAAAAEAFETSVESVESDAAVVASQYYDLTGRKVVDAKGILIRIDTLADGSQRVVKVLRK